MPSPRLLLAVGSVAACVVGIAPLASQGATGGSAPTRTGITVNQTSSTGSSLQPGGPSEALSGTFTNPNPSPVNFTSVTAGVHPFTAQANPGKPACTEADFTIGGSAGPYAGVITGSRWSGLTVALKAGVTNQDNCKSVSIVIDYTATA